ncbi:MAG TPA: mechanosensitive ion channel protein [Ignavibacteriales bacterium]|nr:mechanosensitive ion channel protein [Ignavibacteriales bacterium]
MNWNEIVPELRNYITEFGIHIISAIAILIIGFWLTKLFTGILYKVLRKRNVEPTLIGFLTSSLRFVFYLFVIIAAVGQLGVETTSFIAVLGAAGLAVGLALQGSLSNLAAGVMLVIFRQFKVGQFIEGGGASGTVEKIGIFNTTLVSIDNKVIYIPNSKLINDNITNYNEKETRRVDMVFGISYSDDVNKAKYLINEILKSDERILRNPAPQVVLAKLGESSVNIHVRPWVKTPDYWDVHFDLLESVKKKFDEEKITIPFPQRDIYIHQQ